MMTKKLILTTKTVILKIKSMSLSFTKVDSEIGRIFHLAIFLLR